MSSKILIEFRNEFDLADAISKYKLNGFSIDDVYSPYAIHGLDKLLGLKSSRLNMICFAFALFGLSFALLLEYWLSAINWPINIGGRPWNSFPAFMPIAFEVMILFSGLGTVITFFLWWKFNMNKTKQPSIRALDDRFYCLIEKKPSNDVKLLNEIAVKYSGEILEYKCS